MVPHSCDDAACAGGTDGLQPLIDIRHSTAPTSAAPLPRSGIEMQRPAASAKAPHPTDDFGVPAVKQHCRERAADAPGGGAGDTGGGARAGVRAREGPGMGTGPEDSIREDSGVLE